MLRFKPTTNPCERNKEIAISRGYDMTHTTRAYGCDGEFLYVPDGDTEGLTQEEIDSLEEYTPIEVDVN